MNRKIFTGIAGVIVMLLALSGCNSNGGETSPEISAPEINSQHEAENPANTASNNEAPPTENDSTENHSPGNGESISTDEALETNANTLPSHEDIERLFPEDMEIPEGLVISLPPTMISVGLADGADVPLVAMGERLIFDGQGPVMLDGEVFVPVLGIFDNLNPTYPFITAWDGDTVTIRNPHVTVTITEIPGQDSSFEHRLTISFPSFTPVTPRVSAQRINGEFMLPLQSIAEAIGIEFEWVEERGEVHIFMILEGFGLAVSNSDGTAISLRPPNPFVY